MAYRDYIHCMSCGEKALYWEQWDYIGCAHCPGDIVNAERGVVEVYCPECTEERNPGLLAEPGTEPKPSTWEYAAVEYDPDNDLHSIEEGSIRVEYAAVDPQVMDITVTVSPDEEFTVSLPLRSLPMIRAAAARIIDTAVRTKEDHHGQG